MMTKSIGGAGSYKAFKCKSLIITKGSNIIKEPSDQTHSGDYPN